MKRLLIVDDSDFMRRYLRDILMSKHREAALSEDIECFEANGKYRALQLLNLIKADVILLDIVMKSSVLEGLEIVEAIKDKFDVGKIVIVSSAKQTFLLNKCKEMGIVNYLQKPVECKNIIEAVNKSLKY